VVCVVVTCDRVALLTRCLEAVASQRHLPDHLVVVDNGTEPGVAEALATTLAGTGLPHTLLPSETNLGGAGGYAYGVLAARALGADWVWLADDDGRPGSPWTLGRLLTCAADHALDVVSPLVVDEEDPGRLAFPLRRGLTWVRRREQLGTDVLVPDVANLFNGALFSAHALDVVGVPDPRLFVRGDEVEIHRRLRRSRLRFGTCSPATYLHPAGHDDWAPLAGGRLTVLVPRDVTRRERTFRNLGYLTAQPGLRWRRWPDEARYAWYFLLQRHDVQGWQQWRRLSRQGRREDFGSPLRVPHRSPATAA
jgi:rhamnopyranosyl-N-acetylglucosaminyl-diphospho-decaprenol beta-1,3/1,4-galactofuranosyltransferase